MNTKLFSRVPPHYWGYFTLLLWGGCVLLLLRHDPYAINEGAAKSLLLTWSIADHVASSVVTFGAPDLRILAYLPAGFLWTGNIFAAKVFTVMLAAFTAWLLYTWKRSNADTESALIGTGLLLVLPLVLSQIDELAPGIYLLFALILGAWLNSTYRAAPRPFGGRYFLQLFVCAFSVSLHPAGLAYPFALLWSWYKEPLDSKQQKYFYIGIGLVTVLTLIVGMGWHDIDWMQNPVKTLATALSGTSPDGEMGATRWISGIALLLALVFVIARQYRNLWSDFFGRTLLIALLLGASTFDSAWALLALCIVLYFGFPLALNPAQPSGEGFMHQRGVAMALILVLSTLSMRADRAHYEMRLHNVLSEQDQLIKSLAEVAESARKAAEEKDESMNPAHLLRVASQWPARTMIACRCDTLPLPPAARDPQAQLAMLRGITHMLFNPKQSDNTLLSRNLAVLGGENTELLVMQPGGVLLHFRGKDVSQNAREGK